MVAGQVAAGTVAYLHPELGSFEALAQQLESDPTSALHGELLHRRRRSGSQQGRQSPLRARLTAIDDCWAHRSLAVLCSAASRLRPAFRH